MSKDKKIFDDLARMAGGAVNMMSGLQQQVRDDVRTRFDEFAGKLDLVPRAEFEELHSLVKKLHTKIAALEGGVAKTVKTTAKKVAKKPTVKKTVKTAGKAKAKAKTAAKKTK